MLPMKDVKYKGNRKEKLLCKVFIDKETIKFSIPAKEREQAVLVDVIELIAPYVKPNGISVMKKVCNVVYLRRREELKKEEALKKEENKKAS